MVYRQFSDLTTRFGRMEFASLVPFTCVLN
jgi:hypothetical protein